ncbi:hypothetical protein J6590_081661 [Homalodisca vitripennis]|nr:hypothetical protein J6590_081661 [Homalodisca vitripennis]
MTAVQRWLEFGSKKFRVGAIYVEKNPGTAYRQYELQSVTLNTPNIKVTVDGTITIDANLIATDLKASYEKDTLTLNSKIQKLGERKYIARVDILPSKYPDLGGSVKWEYERTPNKIENNLVIVHGSDLRSEVSRLSIAQLLSYKYESVEDFDFHTENTVSYPLLGFSGLLKGSVAPKSVMYDVDVTYDNHQVKSKLDAKRGMKSPTDYSIDFEDCVAVYTRLSSKSGWLFVGGVLQTVTLPAQGFTLPGSVYTRLSSKSGWLFVGGVLQTVTLPAQGFTLPGSAKALENSVDLSLKHERVSTTKSKFTNSLEMKPGGKYQLNALVENNVRPGDIHQSLDAELKMPQNPKSVKHSFGTLLCLKIECIRGPENLGMAESVLKTKLTVDAQSQVLQMTTLVRFDSLLKVIAG